VHCILRVCIAAALALRRKEILFVDFNFQVDSANGINFNM